MLPRVATAAIDAGVLPGAPGETSIMMSLPGPPTTAISSSDVVTTASFTTFPLLASPFPLTLPVSSGDRSRLSPLRSSNDVARNNIPGEGALYNNDTTVDASVFISALAAASICARATREESGRPLLLALLLLAVLDGGKGGTTSMPKSSTLNQP